MLASRTKGVPLFGTLAPSWRKALAAEEKKPYWAKVRLQALFFLLRFLSLGRRC